ncbi:MAG: Rho termination factor N-terminal domain-containing protein, partial [Ilumatobacteraceae bacterium]
MTAQALEQSALETKDKEQLLAIAKALGLKASARLKKSEIIDQILDTTSGSSNAPAAAPAPAPAPAPPPPPQAAPPPPE